MKVSLLYETPDNKGNGIEIGNMVLSVQSSEEITITVNDKRHIVNKDDFKAALDFVEKHEDY